MEQPPPPKRTKLDEQPIGAADETTNYNSQAPCTELGLPIVGDQTTFCAEEESTLNVIHSPTQGTSRSTVDLRPNMPYNLSGRPVSCVPPFSMASPRTVAGSSTDQAISDTLNFERNVTNLQPTRPVNLAGEPVICVPPSSVTSLQPFIAPAGSSTNQTTKGILNFERNVTEQQPAISAPHHYTVATTVSPIQNYHLLPTSLASLRDGRHTTPKNPVSIRQSQAIVSDNPVPVCSKSISQLHFTSSENYLIPTIAMTQPPHSTALFSATNQPRVKSPLTEESPKSAIVFGPQYHTGQLPTMSNVILSPYEKDSKDYNTTQVTLAVEGSSFQSAAIPHTSSALPLTDSGSITTVVTKGQTLLTTIPQSVSVLVTQSSSCDNQLTLPTPKEDALTVINPAEAGEAFREHRADLLIAITDPLILANSLYSKNIISKETLDKIMLMSLTNSEKNVILLNAVEARIRTNYFDFLTVLAVFGRESHLCVFAEGLRNSYCLRHTQSSLRFHPSDISPVHKLDTYLMSYYNCSQESLDTKFPRLPNKTFITLAVIEKEPISHANADKFTKGTLHGHADEILKKKKPIDLEAVLEPPEGCRNMRCVFVEGAPGVGKSTFALELCRRKKEIKTMNSYSLVILLRLREKRVQGIKNISDLFYHEDSNLVQAVTEKVIACQGKNVLFVLDGFDELPASLRIDSFVVELIQGKHLPACTVLVTSRPSATADLHLTSEIDKHMEILGFTHECIQQYAKSMLSGQPDVLEDFLKYISNNPAIHGMMYIPLNSAIVVEIYKANRTTCKPIPRTLTQLYTELCLVLLRKYLIEKGDPLAHKLQDNLLDLPEDLQKQLEKLGKLAFEGAVRKDITFEKLPDDCDNLGFMNVSSSLYMGRKTYVSYTFLHLTLQEFLAAYYVSMLDDVHQKLLIIEQFYFAKKFRSNLAGSNTHLNVMLRFIAGLTEFKSLGWELTLELLIELGFSQYDCTPLLVQCLLEVQHERKIREAFDAIHRLQCSVFKKSHMHVIETLSISPHTLFDCYAVGRCVAASGCSWIIHGGRVGINELVECLACGLKSVEEVCGYMSAINLSGNDLAHRAMASFSEFPSMILNQITTLNLSFNRLDTRALECLADSLLCMSNLTDLDLSENPCGDGGMVKVFQSLLGTKIHRLSVHQTGLGISDIHALSQLIRPNSSLKKLQIGDTNVPPDATVETILSPSSLEEVELCGINYTNVNASKFQLLEFNRNLSRLNFVDSFDGLTQHMAIAIPHVAKALHNNVALTVLGFVPHQYLSTITQCECDVELDIDSIVKALSEMIIVNKTLVELDILITPLHTDHVVTLSDALRKNETLKSLHLHPDVFTFDYDPRISPFRSIFNVNPWRQRLTAHKIVV